MSRAGNCFMCLGFILLSITPVFSNARNARSAIVFYIFLYAGAFFQLLGLIFIVIELEKERKSKKKEFGYLIKDLKSSKDKIREKAIISLGEMGKKEALPYLEELLNDDSKTIQELSIKAIKEIKNKISRMIKSLFKQNTYNQLESLNTKHPSATSGNNCPYCATDLGVATQLQITKFINCPSCESSVTISQILDGNMCPYCKNSLDGIQIKKVKLILCPSCGKRIKGM